MVAKWCGEPPSRWVKLVEKHCPTKPLYKKILVVEMNCGGEYLSVREQRRRGQANSENFRDRLKS